MAEDLDEKRGLLSSQFTRRNLIKGGAIVGGTVWVAPVIDSFVTRAAAASIPHGHETGGGNFGLCSYSDIIFELNNPPAGVSAGPYVVKISGDTCNSDNTDGSYKSETFPVCNGVTYGVDATNVLTAGGTELPAGSCSYFAVSGSTVTWDATDITVLFVVIHDGSFGGPGCPAGDVSNGNTYCAPTNITLASGCCTG